MWARVHKIDRIRPQPDGRAIVLIEDERSATAMSRAPAISTLIAIARVINARRVLEARYGGKGEVRYASAAATPPSFLAEAVARAGASIASANGETIVIPASPSGVSSVVDSAFAELAHQTRTNVGATDMMMAIHKVETNRRKSPLDRETQPALYWPAVLELTALAGELSRSRGGRWVDTTEMPVPFAIKFPGGELATPAKLAQRIVEGGGDDETLAKPEPSEPGSGPS
ncbi:MAG TPA: hypothetical protein VFQ53_24920 [Kofleriaceae bacterium]|nr:hypothetical protein [Kofleriaceae bacterium]